MAKNLEKLRRRLDRLAAKTEQFTTLKTMPDSALWRLVVPWLTEEEIAALGGDYDRLVSECEEAWYAAADDLLSSAPADRIDSALERIAAGVQILHTDQ